LKKYDTILRISKTIGYQKYQISDRPISKKPKATSE